MKSKNISMFPVVHPKMAMRRMRDVFFFFNSISIEKQQCAIFLTIEQEDILSTHTNNYIGRGRILFDFFFFFASKSETDSNI